MKAILLAAGRGSRMAGLTEARPKCLTPLRSRPLLDWQLQSLRAAGVTEIAAVTGYRGELLARPGLQTFVNPRWAETNMVMSLLAAAAWLRTSDCLVSYSDIVYTPETVSALAAARGERVIASNREWLRIWQARFAQPLEDAESFQVDAQGRLREIGRRATDLAQIQGQYMGLLRFTPAGWRQVETLLARFGEAADRLDMTSLLQALLEAGMVIDTVPIDGGWLEIDSESDLAVAEALIETEPSLAWLRAQG